MSASAIRCNPLVKRASVLATIGGIAAVGAIALSSGSSRADDSAATPPQAAPPAADAPEQSAPDEGVQRSYHGWVEVVPNPNPSY
jgi:hypothetical protein